MSDAKSVPRGLKDTECEKSAHKVHPPISYIPVVDEIQDDLGKEKKKPLSIRLKDKTSFSASIWENRTPGAFFIQVQEALNACTRKGHFKDLEEAKAEIVTAQASIAHDEEMVSAADEGGRDPPRVTRRTSRRRRKTSPNRIRRSPTQSRGSSRCTQTSSAKTVIIPGRRSLRIKLDTHLGRT